MKLLETEILELKRSLSDNLEKEIVAFLNSKGGEIYIGINDDGSVIGVDDVDETLRKLSDIISDRILPNPREYINIKTDAVSSKTVIKMSISKGNSLYYIKRYGRSSAGCFLRIGSTSKPMNEEEIENRYRASLRIGRIPLIDIASRYDVLTFDIMEIKLRTHGIEINEDMFEKNFFLRTKEGDYNLMAELLADKNSLLIQVCTFFGTDKVCYSERKDFGMVSLIAAAMDINHY